MLNTQRYRTTMAKAAAAVMALVLSDVALGQTEQNDGLEGRH